MSEHPFNVTAPEAVIPYAGTSHRQSRVTHRTGTFVTALFVAFWGACGVIALGAMAGAVWLASSRVFAGASPVLGVLLLIALAMLLRGIRRARAVAALNYLEQAVRLNLPLPPMLRAAEAGETGRLRAKLRLLRERLEDGQAVGEAIDYAVPGLPPRAVGLIAAAEYNGRLAPTLTRLAGELRRQPRGDASRAILLRWYPMVLILALSGGLGVVSVFVMPKFQSIFADYHMELPALTLGTMHVWYWLGPPLGVITALVVLMYSGRMVAETVAPHWARANFGPAAHLPEWVLWWLPVAGSVTRHRGLADLCHVLADAAASGRPMHSALRDASRLGVNIVLRVRVERWAEGMERGVPLAQAAREAGLPALVAGMLSTTSAAGAADTQEVFDFLARYYDSRFSRAAALLEGAMVPAMVLVFGAFVASAALGLFLPMVELMEKFGDLSGFN